MRHTFERQPERGKERRVFLALVLVLVVCTARIACDLAYGSPQGACPWTIAGLSVALGTLMIPPRTNGPGSFQGRPLPFVFQRRLKLG